MLLSTLLWIALVGLLGTAYAAWSNLELGWEDWLLFGSALLPGLIVTLDLLGLIG